MHQLALDIMSCVPTIEGQERRKLLAEGSRRALSSVSPADFNDPRSYLEAAQAAAIVRKMPNLFEGDAALLRQKAEETFLSCEAVCKLTNARLAWWVNLSERPFVEDEQEAKELALIRQLQALARDILGPVPTEFDVRFSGGSSFLNVAKMSTLPHKLAGSCAVTAPLSDIFRLILSTCAPHWESLTYAGGLETVRGNRFETVPKDSDKDRGICVEPLGNLALQLFMGKHIRTRLKRWGIDLDDGQQLHQDMAKYASIDGDYATIDLSNASDTVCYQLVKLILPPRWFDLLSLVRSAETRFKGDWVKLEKFSSMGNGYTFELETLLFYVICRVVSGESAIAVYGDDMIIPTDHYVDVVSALRFFGFEPNSKKSFSNGPFRESCGGDYWNGTWVRPVFLTCSPQNPVEWMSLHNRLHEIERLLDWDMAVPKARIVECIPRQLRCWGPPSEDGCLWTDDRALWTVRNRNGWIAQKRLVSIPRKYHSWKEGEEALASALAGVPSSGAAHRDVAGFKTCWADAYDERPALRGWLQRRRMFNTTRV